MVASSSSATRDGLDPLFRPVDLAGCELSNRFVMAPMTRKFASEGVLAKTAINYYRRRAEGGVGLILTEGVATSRIAAHTSDVPDFQSTAARGMWRQVTEAVHGAGGKIMAQLWHTGLGRIKEIGHEPELLSIGPKDTYLAEGNPIIATGGNLAPGRAMSDAEIAATVLEFGEAAAQAQDCGFDGLELHGAHGYLIDQFFWSESNRRGDGYNGDIAGRTRFAREIIAEVRRRTGNGFPLGLRFSQWKLPVHYTYKAFPDPSSLEAFLRPLAAAGIDFFDASTRHYTHPEFPESSLTLAGWTRKITGLPVMAVGSVGLSGPIDVANIGRESTSSNNLEAAVNMIERGEIDLLGVGRALIANPDWVSKLRWGQQQQLVPYNAELLSMHV